MLAVLQQLKDCGLKPTTVVDGGANLGQWSSIAYPIFPNARWHLIEPQPACHPTLRRFCKDHPNAQLHPFALTEPGSTEVCLGGTGVTGGSSGAFVVPNGARAARGDTITCPASTLDDLFGGELSAAGNTLLKLDVEGHELAALEGGLRMLRYVDVVVCEVWFYDVNLAGRPLFSDILSFLASHDFVLFDFASLNGRPTDHRLRTGDAVFVRKAGAIQLDHRLS